MKFKFNALVAALALVASAGSNAAIQGNASTENGSLLFVAYDNVGTPIGLTIDLGVTFADIIQGAALNAPGTTVTWNFNSNTITENSAAFNISSQTNSWAGNFATFMASAQSADLRWGVVGADSVSTNGVIGSNGAGTSTRGVVATGNPTAANVTSTSSNTNISNSFGNLNTFIAASTGSSSVGQTHLTSDNGSNTSVSGSSYLNVSTMRTNFGGNLAWSYLLADGATSRFQRVETALVGTNPTVSQFGTVNTTDGIIANAADAATFTFNSATGELTYSIPAVPEPSTYALMVAGLAAVGFLARRRRA